LEDSYGHKEQPRLSSGSISIEHIMPQAESDPEKLSHEWKIMLGKDFKRIHRTYLHTLGNLTLTGYNPELSDRSFEEKKKILKDSHLELNRYFETVAKWDKGDILKRANTIAEIAVRIWKHPGYKV
jgi:hypothetical protein